MNKETLIKAKAIITGSLIKEMSGKEKLAVTELIININKFLEPKDYEENKRVLNENIKGKK